MEALYKVVKRTGANIKGEISYVYKTTKIDGVTYSKLHLGDNGRYLEKSYLTCHVFF